LSAAGKPGKAQENEWNVKKERGQEKARKRTSQTAKQSGEPGAHVVRNEPGANGRQENLH
jgi:hypothetical protein